MVTPFAFIGVFMATLLADVAWARYVGHVAGRARWLAAGWSVILFLLGAFAVVSYTQNKWLLIPAALGAFAGTVVGVK